MLHCKALGEKRSREVATNNLEKYKTATQLFNKTILMKMATVGQKKRITELSHKAAWARKFEEAP